MQKGDIARHFAYFGQESDLGSFSLLFPEQSVPFPDVVSIPLEDPQLLWKFLCQGTALRIPTRRTGNANTCLGAAS